MPHRGPAEMALLCQWRSGGVGQLPAGCRGDGVNDRFWCSAADLVLGRSFSRGVGRGCCVGLVGKGAERAYYG